jgi:DNA-binding transcriptional LysR family regulator
VDLGQIEAFVQVARHRSFSKAALALFLTQPSVTARIQSLERELGEALFERDGRGVRLTDAGSCFLTYAQSALKALEEGRGALEEQRGLQSGSLRLGSAFTVSTYVLPRILKTYHQRFPGVEISVKTGRSDQVLRMVMSEEVQAGLARAVVRPDIQTVLLYEDEMVLVTNPEHAFAAIGEACLEDVGREPFILLDKTSSYHSLVQSLFRQAGVVPWAVMELDSLEAAKKMVEEGLGIAMLPRVAVEREVGLRTLTEIKLRDAEGPRRRIALIYRRNRRTSRTMIAFLGLLHETYGFEWPTGIGKPSGSVLTRGVE